MQRGGKIAVTTTAAIGVVIVGAMIAGVVLFRGIERVDYALDEARDRLQVQPNFTPRPGATEGGDAAEDELEVYLIVGSDARQDLGGSRADVIMLGILRGDGEDPALVSLPRDLWIDDLCRGGRQRINAALNGCGQRAGGPELLTLTVEHFTGLPVDHYLEVDFDGFTEMVDTVGGVRICNDHRIRDGRWELPGGCQVVDGEDALLWVRSRKTQEFVDGRWRTMPGVNDLTRNQRQQELLLEVFRRATRTRSPGQLQALAGEVAEVVTVDETFGLNRAVRTAWRWRNLDTDTIQRPVLEVTPHTTGGGAQVLLPAEDFDVILHELGLE